MARGYGKIMLSAWDDEEFTSLSAHAMLLYFFLISQPDMTMAGIIPLRPARWSDRCKPLDAGAVRAALDELVSRRFAVADPVKGDLLIRSFMRHDEVWRLWNLLESARVSVQPVRSMVLRDALAAELSRIRRDCPVRGKATVVLQRFMDDVGSESLQVRGHMNSLPERSDFPPDDRVEDWGDDRPPVVSCSVGAEVQVRDKDQVQDLPDGSPLREDPSPEPAVAGDGPVPQRRQDEPGEREDVERLCQHLADRLEEQYGQRPNITKARWRSAARYMLDIDHRTEEQVHAAIDWCQDDEFWRANIRSMSKLREKYIQLRAAAQRQKSLNGRSTTNDRVRQALDLAERYAEQEKLEAMDERRKELA